MTAAEFRSQLAHFTGSETFTRHSLSRSLLMTEGVVFLPSRNSAFWLDRNLAILASVRGGWAAHLGNVG